ncbi:YcnI family protein [Microbacterium sp. ARD31]|uniref:YcnI family copper-binding membrane protein n=1 Tax=Microbacterium sp. ARD31 TaxID=2962576 RepID=UPI00288206F7|nr:YcnI family protein [Microbacterium sp. ARD31]MDT0188008.1 YcnI family protein [Microbacterium sp. ARD31]
MDRSRPSLRRPACGVLAGALVLLGAAPASAHVTLTPSTTVAGATAEVRMLVPHGCEGSATTEVAVRMPAAVSEVAADDSARWRAEQGGGAITFRTDAPLPDGVEDAVEFSVRLPDDPGATLVFPVVQRCEEGEAAWTEVAADEASREALEMPAPVIVVTAAAGSEHAMALGAAGVLTIGCLVSGGVLLLRRRRA